MKFKHSGDMGDIIYSLPAIRACGGGDLYLDVTGGQGDELVRNSITGIDRIKLKFSEYQYDFIKPLLCIQPYITSVSKWAGEDVDVNLNGFRKLLLQHHCLNLCEAHLRLVDKNDIKQYDPWLFSEKHDKGYLVIARSLINHGSDLFWRCNHRYIAKHGLFVGTKLEHEVMCEILGEQVAYTQTDDALALAQIIASGREMWANDSMPMAVCVGLGGDFVQERNLICQRTIFPMRNSRYI